MELGEEERMRVQGGGPIPSIAKNGPRRVCAAFSRSKAGGPRSPTSRHGRMRPKRRCELAPLPTIRKDGDSLQRHGRPGAVAEEDLPAEAVVRGHCDARVEVEAEGLSRVTATLASEGRERIFGFAREVTRCVEGDELTDAQRATGAGFERTDLGRLVRRPIGLIGDESVIPKPAQEARRRALAHRRERLGICGS